jgi:hypothetical protein
MPFFASKNFPGFDNSGFLIHFTIQQPIVKAPISETTYVLEVKPLVRAGRATGAEEIIPTQLIQVSKCYGISLRGEFPN